MLYVSFNGSYMHVAHTYEIMGTPKIFLKAKYALFVGCYADLFLCSNRQTRFVMFYLRPIRKPNMVESEWSN